MNSGTYDCNNNDLRAKHSRPNGSNNYSTADIKALLDFVEDIVPLGQKGWQLIHSKFTQWAGRNGHPLLKAMSLKTKFKQLVKTTKPMGDRVCPPDITRAHELDALINEHAGTCDLNNLDHNTYDDELNCNKQTVKVQTASELLSRISGAFDPAVQQAQDKDCATRSLANTQLLAQGQQLHDANGVAEKLRTQLFDLQTRLYEAKSAPKTRHQYKPKPKQADYAYYPNGSQCVVWHSDPDTPASDALDHPPSSPQYTHPTPAPFNSTPSSCLAHHCLASRLLQPLKSLKTRAETRTQK
ncbi:hypothetical protein BDR07DRAFT_1482712 [Suillus spraguei]|nr:hypothetical protein BDR07DRAFT_1482712 [Suillus spraguei]